SKSRLESVIVRDSLSPLRTAAAGAACEPTGTAPRPAKVPKFNWRASALVGVAAPPSPSTITAAQEIRNYVFKCNTYELVSVFVIGRSARPNCSQQVI